MNQSNGHNPENETPQELRAMAVGLDNLAAAERASAAPGIEERVFATTRGMLAEAPALAIEPKPVAGARQGAAWLGRSLMRLRVAAAVALAGGLGAVWLSTAWRTSNAGTSDLLASIEEDVDSMVRVDDPLLGGPGRFSQEINLLFADMTALNENMGQRWRVEDELLNGGAM